jgi:tetratricopeptide (TPR) repeat protein
MERLGQFLLGLIVLLAGVSLVLWFIWHTIKKSHDPGRILFKWTISFVFLIGLVVLGAKLGAFGYAGAFIGPITAAILGIILAILWAPHLGAVLAKPITSFYDGGDEEVEVRPFYSIARAKQKRGRYGEAVVEVRKQLERFPTDYEGWMLLAEIYARDLKDHLSAQDCLEEIIRQPGHTPRNISYTLNRSADWHLELGGDRDAARAALEEIIRRFPDSEFSHTASQRVAHLTTGRMLDETRERPTIHLTRRDEYIGLEGKAADPRPSEVDAGASATGLLEHLRSHPDDVEAREKLATIYADHYGRMDLVADQVEQLIATRGATQKEIAHWLNMLVDFHLRVDQDRAGAEAALNRIIALFPRTAVAGLAESRLAYLDGEFRRNAKSQVLRLGSYEDNLGLKGKVSQKPL